MSNPTTLVEPFNGALGAFSGVAPIRYNGGLWLEEGATNLATTPLAPTVLAYGHITSATVTGLSIDHPLGGHSDRVKRVTIASGAGGTDQFGANVSLPSPPASGTSFRCSVLMQFSAGRIGDTVQLQLGQRTGAGTVVTTTLKSYVVSGAMQLLSDDIVMSTADRTTIYVYVRSNAAGDQDIGSTFDVTFLDVRQSPYSTSACPSVDSSGTILSGWIWSGTAHASTSTRAASSASISPAGILSPSSGAIAFRITPTIETGVEEIWGECGVKGSGTDHVQWGRDASKHPFVEWSSNDASYQRLTASETWNALVAKTLYLGWDSTTAYLQVDSGTLQTHARDAVSASWGAGNLKLQASKGGNIVTPFSAYSEHLNDTDRALVIAAIAAGGSNLATVLDDAAAPLRTMNIRTNALLRQ